jgi:hypothetical protein
MACRTTHRQRRVILVARTDAAAIVQDPNDILPANVFVHERNDFGTGSVVNVGAQAP